MLVHSSVLMVLVVVVAIVVEVSKLPCCCVFPISLVVVLVPVLVDGRWWCTPDGGYGGASQVFTSTSSRQPPQNIARSLPGRGAGGGLRFEFMLEALYLQ